MYSCKCNVCKQVFEDEYGDDAEICPACHGEWLLNYLEESSHEPPEEEP